MKRALFVVISLLLSISCAKKKNTTNNELSLDPRYFHIKSINTFAHCNGPNGSYTTQVISKKNGYLLFSQVYEYRDSPFIGELSSDNKGYAVDKDGKILDTLSNIAVEMIRSHDFHRLQTNPWSFFDQIKYERNFEPGIDLYSGIDRLNNPIKIYYDNAIEQIRTIEFLNMMNTTETIQVTYQQWEESMYGKLAKKVEIIQAKKDTFHFDFKTIKINE